jgi:hypothetical protein
MLQLSTKNEYLVSGIPLHIHVKKIKEKHPIFDLTLYSCFSQNKRVNLTK